MVEEAEPRDTFFDYDCSPECTEWKHGALFVNGFNVGRYHQAGPQKTLYIPGPLLKQGANDIGNQNENVFSNHQVALWLIFIMPCAFMAI